MFKEKRDVIWFCCFQQRMSLKYAYRQEISYLVEANSYIKRCFSENSDNYLLLFKGVNNSRDKPVAERGRWVYCACCFAHVLVALSKA